MSEDVKPLRIEESDVRLHLGVVLGKLFINNANLSLHLYADIRSPYLKAEAHIKYTGGIGDLNSIYAGADASIVYSGGPNVSEEYKLGMTIVDVEVPMSQTRRTPSGEIIVRMVSRWAYHSKGSATKAYPEVTSLSDVITEELREIGFTESHGLEQLQTIEPLDTPINLFRTRGVLHFLSEDVLPWCLSDDGSPLFWYSTLKGSMMIQSSMNMRAQGAISYVGPSFVFYKYDEPDLIGYAFQHRSYKTNPKRTEIFKVKGAYYKQGAAGEFTEEDHIDFPSPGRAIQLDREMGTDVLTSWYVGSRPLQQMKAQAKFLRRDHLFHQIHVLTIEDLHAATHCDVGTVVRLYDFDIYMPEDDEAPKEELELSNMAGEYIVVASHYYFDEMNEDGFKGSKLELAKLTFDPENLEDIPNLSGYVEI